MKYEGKKASSRNFCPSVTLSLLRNFGARFQASAMK